MNRDEAIAVLKDASWTYTRRISPAMPFPAAITAYPGMSFDILKDAGIDVSGKNGEGVAILPQDEDGNPRYAVFGRKNTLYMNEQDIEFGQSNRIVRLDLGDMESDGGIGVG